MFITPSFKKSLIVEQFQGNYLNAAKNRFIKKILTIKKLMTSQVYDETKN